MKISTIIWAKVKVKSFQTWDWENCTIDFRTNEKQNTYKNGIAWIQRIDCGATTDDNLTFVVTKILELTPWTFKADGTVANGDKLVKATLEAEF